MEIETTEKPHVLTDKRENADWWRTFDAISDFIFIQDEDFTIVKANKAFVDLLGVRHEDIIGRKCYEVFHKSDRPWSTCPFERTREDKMAHTQEVNDPNIGIPLLVTTSPIFDDKGEFAGSVHIAKDISERKKAEEALKTSKASFHNIVEKSADGIIVVDRGGIMQFVNQAAEALFGREAEELLGELFGFPVMGGEVIELDVVRHGKEPGIAEMRVAETEWNGQSAYLALLRDITERKLAEEKLKEAIEMKSEFMSVASHELRTPLTAMKEAIRLVITEQTGKLNDEQKEFLDIAKRNVDRLARLVNDVLDFQKLGAGKMEFEIRENDINEVTTEVYAAMAPTAKSLGIDFFLDLEKDMPKVKFDRDKITQVLTNLVANAQKFTERGNITVSTSKGENVIQVSVSDTGPGIRAEDLPKVFREFEQLQKGGDRKVGGTGLGLAISKEIIEQHRGKICVESEYGKGTTFHFILPIWERRKTWRRES